MNTGTNTIGEDLPGDEPTIGVALSLLNGSTDLSSKACWYLAVIRSTPRGQMFNMEDLGKPFKDGVRATTAAIDELEENGYLKRVTVRAENGLFAGKVWYSSYRPRFEKKPKKGAKKSPKADAPKQQIGQQSADMAKPQTGLHNANVAKPQVGEPAQANMPDNQRELRSIGPQQAGDPTQIASAAAVGAFISSSISNTPAIGIENTKEKKIEAPKTTGRKLTEVGTLLAQEYSKWRLAKHGQAYDLAKVSDGAAKAFNSMGQTLLNKHADTPQKAAACFARILAREDELDQKYYGPKLFSPTRMEQEFLAIVKQLYKGGAVSAESAVTAVQDAQAARTRQYRLNRLNMWLADWKLPRLAELSAEDEELIVRIDALKTQHIKTYPTETRFAAQWQALNQPVHA